MELDPEINDSLKKYFTFSRREYKAALALFLLTFFIWFFTDIKNYFFPPTFNVSLIGQRAKELDALQKDLVKEQNATPENEYPDGNDTVTRKETSIPVYFVFNPNTASEEDFQKLGFTKKQIHIITNFRSKLGEIKSKTDFKKIYGISESQFDKLSPYLNLPETRSDISTIKNGVKHKNTPELSIELNSADSTELDKLPGIGMGYARRIIKYRTALGGFINTGQLMEVYGFRQSLLDTISPFIWLDVSKIERININTISFELLKKHPYIKYKLAGAIINYRSQHGKFQAVDEVKNVVLITSEIYDKIKSYLTVD